MTREELIEKAKQLAENKATYTDRQACWQGDYWVDEKGYFTENGVCRFADTPMELFETYEEIDEQILEDCINSVDDGIQTECNSVEFEPTDRIDELATELASEFADELFTQNGFEDIASDHDDCWYEVQEAARNEILRAIERCIPDSIII